MSHLENIFKIQCFERLKRGMFRFAVIKLSIDALHPIYYILSSFPLQSYVDQTEENVTISIV